MHVAQTLNYFFPKVYWDISGRNDAHKQRGIHNIRCLLSTRYSSITKRFSVPCECNCHTRLVSILQCFFSKVSKLYASTIVEHLRNLSLVQIVLDQTSPSVCLATWLSFARRFHRPEASDTSETPTYPFASHDRRSYCAWLIRNSRLTVGSSQRRRACLFPERLRFVSRFDILRFRPAFSPLAEIVNRVASCRNIAESLDESPWSRAIALLIRAYIFIIFLYIIWYLII